MSKQHQNRTEHQRGAAYQLSKESAYAVGLTAPLFQLKASVPLSENPDPQEQQQVGVAILQRKRVAQFDKEKEPLTSDQLEEMLPLLIGGYTKSGEVLVPANTPSEVKYQFYKQIAESQGIFSEDPGSINLISIRGLIMTTEGLKQTSSAAAFKEAWKTYFDDPKELKKQHHFSDGKTARRKRKKDIADLGGEGSYDDINIVIHRSKEAKESASESAESSPNEFLKDGHTISVQERKTSVDPGTVGSKYGSAHLRDGQHDYKLGDHGTTTYKKAPKHLQKPKIEGNTIYVKTAHARYAENMFGLTKSKNQVEAASKPDHKTRYPALRIDTDVNFGAIWRAEDKDDSSAAGHFTPERISEIRAKDEEEKDKEGKKTFEGSDLNYHMGGNDSSFSQGCQNVMQSEYKAFIKTFQDAKEKKKKLSFKYTLIDASKIDLKIVGGKIVPRQTDDQRAMQKAIIDSLPKEISINEMSLPQLSPLPAIESPTTVGPEQTQTQRKIPRQFRSERHQKSFLSARPIQRDTDPRAASRKIPPGRLIKESVGTGGVNHPDDVASIYTRLQEMAVISAEEAEDTSEAAIIEFVKKYQAQIGLSGRRGPDGNISAGGTTENALLERKLKKLTRREEQEEKEAFLANRKLSRNYGQVILEETSYDIDKEEGELTGNLLQAGSIIGTFTIEGYIYEDRRKRDTVPSSITYELTTEESGNLMEDAKEGSIIHLKSDRIMAKTASNWYVSEEMWERDVKEGERPWMKGHKMRSKAQLEARLKKLRDENKIVLSDEAFMALLIVSSTESSGLLQTINSYDSDVMSMGFVQFTMTGKLQKLIAENEAAFKKHGIELSQSRETIKYRRGKKIMGTGLKGTADIQELRNPYWAAKFYEAGMDDDIIKAQVEEFKKHFQDFKRRKLKKGTDASNTSLVAHFASAEVTGILMEFNNNRPAYVKSVIETVLEEFGDREEITRDEFLSVLKEKMIAKYVREEGNTEEIRRKGKNIVENGHAMYEANRDLMED